MNALELLKNCGFELINEGENKKVSSVYCCDLLSFVMGRAKSEAAWVTVMGNINSAAVAMLADISVIILADNVKPDENLLSKAKEENITIALSKLPIFETSLKIYEELKNA